MVNVNFELGNRGLGVVFKKIERELKVRKPIGVNFVTDPENAHFVIEHCLGNKCRNRVKAKDKPYFVIQYCFKTCGYTHETKDAWHIFWKDALGLFSYYDLRIFSERMVMIPLGADSEIFRPDLSANRDIGILTTGYCPKGEPIQECHEAAVRAGMVAAHVGGAGAIRQAHRQSVKHFQGVPERHYSRLIKRCKYVSALRWIEGFETSGVEALLCGIRPIVFDLPCYRNWYGEHVHYVVHDMDGDLVSEVEEVIRRDPVPVQDEELKHIRNMFSWDRIARIFWDNVMKFWLER